MSRYRAVAKFRIQPGKTEEFRRIAAESVAIVRAKDPGTPEYEWFMNEAGTECIVVETYEGDEALQAHGRNVGHLVGKLLQISQVSVDMLCTPTPAIREQLKRMPMTLYTPFAGVQHSGG
jgi:quinol monooxygenase YgiN